MENQFPKVVPLNVGGRRFSTFLSTLLRHEDSMLAAMFSGRHQVEKDKDGCYFIDRDGGAFAHILEFLRHGKLPPPNLAREVYTEAQYFGLQVLADKLAQFRDVREEIAYKEQLFKNQDTEMLAERVLKAVSPVITGTTRVALLMDAGWKARSKINDVVPNIVPSRFLENASWQTHECLQGDNMNYIEPLCPDDLHVRVAWVTQYLQERGYRVSTKFDTCQFSLERGKTSVWSDLMTVDVFCGVYGVTFTIS
ncbi:PREDICTED: BTB/POZ domain-containing protein KCTD6-like [Branchiostoma belcheri]|uniref:BTB/POZ domain-containing protein KCTD6-like n=1 Tax=Branchiostoma belcheri TaxID=7741 RepID=A0A6P4Y6T9_BRABE|nr:PREDICTED: BTB/POZ domain-containing protein KCTD6-like [Branchiostoma belcheri]XP_019614463.1 PREDICTED: BTB/POZ domain-containing protein KCTD6-like [Branchiostoma belcheri]